MYSKFDVKKEQELIILNYYIEMNLDGTVFNKSIREIANALDINKNRVQKLMLKLQEKGVIEKVNSTCKAKGTYLYKDKQNISTDSRTDIGTEKACKNNGYNEIVETDLRTVLGADLNTKEGSKNNRYKELITDIFDNANKTQIDLIIGIEKLETIELDLFKSILKESALKATKNPISYAHKMLINTIKDNVITLEERENSQRQRIIDNDKKSNDEYKKNWNYMDDSENDDFDRLARLSRER